MKRLVFLLTFRAETEKIEAVVEDFVPGLSAHFFTEGTDAHQFGIHDFFALRADYMRVRCRIESVVAIASVGEAQFQDLIELLEEGDRLVYRGQARRGEFGFDFSVDIIDARVPFAGGENPEDCQALRRDAEIAPLQLGEHFINSFFWFCRTHGKG